jgi:hypothetical protein
VFYFAVKGLDVSLSKLELQLLLLNDQGVKADDAVDRAKYELSGHEGGLQYLKQCAQGIAGLVSHVQKDIDEGKFTEIEGSLKIGEAIIRYINRAVGLIDNVATAAEVNIHTARGKVQAHDDTVKRIKKEYEVLKAKKLAIEGSITNDEVEEDETGSLTVLSDDPKELSRRPSGVHPGNPLKDRERKKKGNKTT